MNLTDRELEVLRALPAAKFTIKGVAEILCIEACTVAKHVAKICRKLGEPNKSAAHWKAHQDGMV